MTRTDTHTTAPTTDTEDAQTSTLQRLHEEETGAQAMEYAALAGGGVTIVTILIELMRNERVQDAVVDFITGLFDGLAGSLGSIF